MPGKMTTEEAYAYIDAKPGRITLTTIGRDGYPHSLPIGYFRMGDEVFLGGRAGTQKMLNAERNAKVSLLLESGETMQDIKGLMIQGEATVISAADDVLPLAREAARQRGAPADRLPEQAPPGAAFIRVTPRKMISWDYARES